MCARVPRGWARTWGAGDSPEPGAECRTPGSCEGAGGCERRPGAAIEPPETDYGSSLTVAGNWDWEEGGTWKGDLVLGLECSREVTGSSYCSLPSPPVLWNSHL